MIDLPGGGTIIDVASYDIDGTTISDMTCYGAVYVTSNELTDSYTGHLTVTADGPVDDAVVIAAVEEAGYEAVRQQT